MQKLNYRNIRSEMKQENWHQGYLFYGEEKYLINQLIDMIISKFIPAEMQDIDLIRIKIDSMITSQDLLRIKQELQTPAFLSERKVIIVENSHLFSTAEKGKNEEQKKNIAEFEEILSLLNPYCCLVFIEEGIDARKKSLLNNLEKNDLILVEIQKEEFNVLLQWIQAQAQKSNLKITKEAAEALIGRCESSMTEIRQEMYKVILYAQNAEKSGIDLNMINFVCRPDINGNIFQLTEAIARGRAKEALRLLNILLMNKEPLPLIRFMFNRHIKQLICAKELQNERDLIKQAKIHPYAAKKLMQQINSLKMSDLEFLYHQSFLSDWQVKKGLMEDRLSFETLLIKSSLTFANRS